MYFHSSWHSENRMDTSKVKDWNCVTVQDKGVYVGDMLALFNRAQSWRLRLGPFLGDGATAGGVQDRSKFRGSLSPRGWSNRSKLSMTE